MKIKLNPFIKNAANALLTTMIFIMILALSIGGYMTYVLQQVRLGSRSQAWNMAMAVSEAGIEEGCEHLNDDAPNKLGSGDWQSSASGVYFVKRNLNGTFASSYTVTITYTNPMLPSMTSVANVSPPAVARHFPFFYAALPSGQPAPTATVGRGIQAILNKPPLFNAALAAKGNIVMNGNNITVDSFDSGIPGQNVNGQWSTSVSGDQGVVASDGGIANLVNVGNANIYGSLYVGPNEGTNIGPKGFVGTHQWEKNGGKGIEPGHFFDNANFSFPDTSLPSDYTSYLSPAAGTVSTINGVSVTPTNYANVLSDGKYLANSTLLSNTIVTGAATLVMPNGFDINNLIIAPGGSLLVYSGGSSFSMSSSAVQNQPGLAQNLIIYCTTNVTSIGLSGNDGINAVVVAPNANVTLSGGGNNAIDFSGSLMADTITLNGHWNFHYDVALTRVPSPGRYILASWKEIPVAPQ